MLQISTLCLLLNDVGLHSWAADRVAYNFAHFINEDGSLPECMSCSLGGFGDALADYGEQLELFASTAIAQVGNHSGISIIFFLSSSCSRYSWTCSLDTRLMAYRGLR